MGSSLSLLCFVVISSYFFWKFDVSAVSSLCFAISAGRVSLVSTVICRTSFNLTISVLATVKKFCLLSHLFVVSLSICFFQFVHRDLASRNVLLGKNNIPMVSDFGLARDIYESGAYETTSGVSYL